MDCHEPAGDVGQSTRLARSGAREPGHAGGHVEMLQALPCMGLAGCDAVTGVSQAAPNVVGPGEMRCDELCTSAGAGTLGERVERAYGDWRSTAVVAIVALALLGE
jgi:hypothetical protein